RVVDAGHPVPALGQVHGFPSGTAAQVHHVAEALDRDPAAADQLADLGTQRIPRRDAQAVERAVQPGPHHRLLTGAATGRVPSSRSATSGSNSSAASWMKKWCPGSSRTWKSPVVCRRQPSSVSTGTSGSDSAPKTVTG